MTNTTNNFKKNHGIESLVLASFFLIAVITIHSNASSKNAVQATALDAFENFSFSHSAFEELIVSADVVYIENLETSKTLYQKNAHLARPLASLTKIMTAYAALNLFPEDTTIQIQSSDLRATGDHGLIVGEVWELSDLLVVMLLTSSNDSALAISREAEKFLSGETFSEYMTRMAKDLGFDSLVFYNATGLDLDLEETQPGAVGTAEDMSKLFSLAYKSYPHIFNPTKNEFLTIASNTTSHNFENTNTELPFMSGVIGSKTGYTKTAGGNLSVIIDIDGSPHIATVLQSTRQGRFQDVERIINSTKKETND